MMGLPDAEAAIGVTRRWLERFVIGQRLCPFAAAPYHANRIAYRVSEACTLDGVFHDFLVTLEECVASDPREQETALLILTRALGVFDDYLDALDLMERAVNEAGLDGRLQLASFHPDYRFEGAAADDPANFSNRSPLPMFHLIREDGLAAALEAYPEPARIPARNIRHLRRLGLDRVRALLSGD
jgi:hypothetical protein